MLLVNTIFLALAAHCASPLAQSTQPTVMPIDRTKNITNRWKVMGTNLRRTGGATPRIGASFSLFRSYYEPCPEDEFGEGMRVYPCGWLVPQYPIACSGDPSGNATNQWYTCSQYPKAVEGEQQVPLERQQWLKWRVFDLEEGPMPPDPMPGYGISDSLSPFLNVKFEFVNGVPEVQSSSNTSIASVKTFSTTFIITKNMTLCGFSYSDHRRKLSGYDCSPSGEPPFQCPHFMMLNECAFFVNVTEGRLSMNEFRMKYGME